MRNFFIIVGVFLGAVLLAFIGMGLFLMLSPGAKLFGVQYVKAVETSSIDVTRKIEDAPSGSIIIETYGVPTNIEYSTSGFFEFNFVQKFNGFTRTDIERPNLSVYTDDDGNLVVKTTEFVPFIWGSNKSGYVLNCKIPASYVNHAITMSSTKSNVVVKTDEYATAKISELSVITKGTATFLGRLNIENLKINSTKSNIVLPDTMSLQNADINSGNKSVKIECGVTGKLSFKSEKGSLTFVSCGELNAETKKGAVESSSKGTSVQGNAVVSTTSGNVVLQHIGGDLQVKTTSGHVYIGQNLDSAVKGVALNTNIETTKGNVYLIGEYGSAMNPVKITTKTGNVFVGNNSRTDNEKKEVPLSNISIIEISTTKGKVDIESATTINATTISGNVVVGSFKNVNITTSSGDVDVTADENVYFCNVNIQTDKKGNVSAKNISNESTTINSKGSVYVSFRTVKGKIDITGKDKDVTVILPDTINEASIIWVDSNNANSLIRVNQIYENTNSYHSQENVSVDEQNKLIKVTSGNGKITLVHERFA